MIRPPAAPVDDPRGSLHQRCRFRAIFRFSTPCETDRANGQYNYLCILSFDIIQYLCYTFDDVIAV